MNFKLFIYLFITCTHPVFLIGQEDLTKTIEITLEDGWESPEIHVLEDNKFLFINRKNNKNKNLENWIVSKYNSDLTVQSEIIFDIENKLYRNQLLTKTNLFILFTKPAMGTLGGIQKNQFEVVQINLKTLEIYKYYGESKAGENRFLKEKDGLLLVESSMTIHAINTITKKQIIIPCRSGVFDRVFQFNNESEIIISEKINKEQLLFKYNLKGELISKINLTQIFTAANLPTTNLHLFDIQFFKDDSFLVIGKPNKGLKEGVFLVRMTNKKILSTTYFPFCTTYSKKLTENDKENKSIYLPYKETNSISNFFSNFKLIETPSNSYYLRFDYSWRFSDTDNKGSRNLETATLYFNQENEFIWRDNGIGIVRLTYTPYSRYGSYFDNHQPRSFTKIYPQNSTNSIVLQEQVANFILKKRIIDIDGTTEMMVSDIGDFDILPGGNIKVIKMISMNLHYLNETHLLYTAYCKIKNKTDSSKRTTFIVKLIPIEWRLFLQK